MAKVKVAPGEQTGWEAGYMKVSYGLASCRPMSGRQCGERRELQGEAR